MDSGGKFTEDLVSVRKQGEFRLVKPEDVTAIDVSASFPDSAFTMRCFRIPRPARAKTCAMPLPINPAPMTPIVCTPDSPE